MYVEVSVSSSPSERLSYCGLCGKPYCTHMQDNAFPVSSKILPLETQDSGRLDYSST